MDDTSTINKDVTQSTLESPPETAAPPKVYDLSDPTPVQAEILEALKVVRDPEIPVNVVDLGLIYGVEMNDEGHVDIDMTLTSMGCPVQDMIQADAELAAMKVDGVKSVTVEFVWSPPWSPDKMSDDGKKQMRMFGFNL